MYCEKLKKRFWFIYYYNDNIIKKIKTYFNLNGWWFNFAVKVTEILILF
jgi:hypothetical protein